MARRNNSRKLPNRPRYLPMIGDPGPLPAEPYIDNDIAREMLIKESQGISLDEQLSSMTEQELFSVAIMLGAKTTDTALLGIRSCIEHLNMKEFIGVVSSVRYSSDVVWCHGCFQYYRYA